MATLDIGGRRVVVDDSFMSLSPEQQNATVEEISASLAPKAAADVPTDMAKSAGVGLGEAAIGVAGGAGDLKDALSRGADAAAAKLGIPQQYVDTAKGVAGKVAGYVNPILNIAPTSEQIKNKVQEYTGEFYEPQTTPGRYTKGAAEFLPGALLPGGSGKVRVVSALLGGLGSVGGGDVAEALGAKRGYGELAGGIAGSLAPTTFAKNAQTMLAPASKDLKASYKAAQQSPEVQGLVFNPQAATNEASRIAQVLERNPNSFRDRNVPQTFREVREGLPNSMSFDDLNAVRKNLNDVAQANRGMPEAVAAGVAKKELDNFLENLRQPDVLLGDAQKAAATMRRGNADYAAAKRADLLDEAVAKAERQAGRAGAGQNFENALRQQLSRIRENPKKIAGFNAEERKLMDKIIKGSFGGNILRHIGKLAPNGVVSTSLGGGIGAGVGAATGNDPIASAGVALGIGSVARGLSNRNTLRKVQELNAKTRARSPLAPPNARVNDINPRLAATLRALLAEQGAPIPQQRQPVEQY